MKSSATLIDYLPGMLRLLRIRDFALIRELELEFGPGLNLLTGETGSGKSILVDALGLLVGERSSPEMVRTGCTAAVVEGAFAPDSGGEATRLLAEAGIAAGEDGILIRREITTAGRNRIFVNNCLATAALLRSVGAVLADIHGQHDRQLLLDSTAQLAWLDRFGGNQDEVQQVRAAYRSVRDLAARMQALRIDEQERLRRIDILAYQVEEIRKAKLTPNEKEELEAERRILANREKVHALASEAYALLYEDEPSLLSQTRRLVKVLQQLEVFDAAWTARIESLEDTAYKLEDLAFSARDYTSRSDFTPERLDDVEQRLAELERLTRKYGSTIAEILAYGERCARELEGLESRADTLEQLSGQLQSERLSYARLARALSEKRQHQASHLEKEIRREFQALAMEKMELSVRFDVQDDSNDPSLVPSAYGPTGVDHVEFLIAPNRGEEMRPLARIASGGELSRIMLSIRTVCGGGEPDKTLVFDEVDAGIGGRVAEAVGRRLLSLSQDQQVLCVTHLPQIAAFATRHFTVSKNAVGQRTETSVQLLEGAERVQELARMLGGEAVTETARRHAREMLAHAAEAQGKQAKG